MNDLEIAARLAVAALAGLAVGFEREWSGHATGPEARFAGIRTFLLLGAVAGIAGWLSDAGAGALAVALVAGAAGVSIAGFVVATRRTAELDGTTEVAALAVLAIGVLAGRGHLALASGSAAVVVLVLGEKATFRRWIAEVDQTEMRAALHFAILALVVLPLLPEGPYGPYDAIRPRMLWTVVLILSGVNFAGYVARQALGDSRGHLVTGALGGLISSTAVTLAYARRSRAEPEQAVALAGGTVAASTVLVPRVIAVAAALNPPFAGKAAVALVGVFLVAVLITLTLARRSGAGGPPAQPARDGDNPLQLGQAIKMAVAFQVVLLALDWARGWFGDRGLLTGAALAGLTDMDALTLSLSGIAEDPGMAGVAAEAVLVGVIANTVLKTAVAVTLGSRGYAIRVAAAFLGMAATGAAAWLLVGRRLVGA